MNEKRLWFVEFSYRGHAWRLDYCCVFKTRRDAVACIGRIVTLGDTRYRVAKFVREK